MKAFVLVVTLVCVASVVGYQYAESYTPTPTQDSSFSPQPNSTAPGLRTAIPGDGKVYVEFTGAFLMDAATYRFDDVIGYDIQIKESSAQDYKTVATIKQGDTTYPRLYTYTITGLTNGVKYDIRVVAYGDDLTVGSNRVTVIPVTSPSEPTNFYASWHDSTVVLHWDDPNDDGGTDITHYVISFRIGTVNPFVTLASIPLDDHSFGYTYTVSDLTNGIPYQFAIMAVNSAGNGQISTINATPAGAPYAPPNFTATESGGTITLSWDEPDDRGSPIRYYSIVAFIDGSRSQTWIGSVPGTQTSHTITGLSYEDKIEFRIDATNSLTRGSYSTVTLTAPS